MITAEHVCYHFKDQNFTGKNDSHNFTSSSFGPLNFEISNREFVHIWGLAQSGKTTLADLLVGFKTPSSGKLLIDDQEPAYWRSSEKPKIGLVRSNPSNQLFAPTVFEEVAFGLDNLNYPDAEIHKKVFSILKTFNLEDKIHQTPNFLSGGEEQRLVIASMLAVEPEILVLDEPALHLDRKNLQLILQLLKKIVQEKGTTVIFLSAWAYPALVADKVLLLENGQIILEGASAQILSGSLPDSYELSLPEFIRLQKKKADDKIFTLDFKEWLSKIQL